MFKYRLQHALNKRIEHQTRAEKQVIARRTQLRAEEQRFREICEQERRLAGKQTLVRQESLGTVSIKGHDVQRRVQYLQGLSADVAAATEESLVQKQAVEI